MGADSVCCIDTKGVCDIVTCNKKYIFGLHPSFWHRAPKTWNFLCDESYKGVFCYVIGLTLEPHLRMGAGCQENQPCDQKTETFLPALDLQERDWGWRLNHLIDHVYVMMPPEKPRRRGFGKLPDGQTHGNLGKVLIL